MIVSPLYPRFRCIRNFNGFEKGIFQDRPLSVIERSKMISSKGSFARMSSFTMRQVLFSALAVLGLSAVSSANCYVLQNNTNYTQTWHFQYNTPIGAGQITQLQMQPHGHYPGNGQWCWSGTGGFQATVNVDNGAYKPSWHGPFVMGDGTRFSPSGTYSLNPPPPPARRKSSASMSSFEPCDACMQRCRNNLDACIANISTNDDPDKQAERRAICDNNYSACTDDCNRNSCNSTGATASSGPGAVSRTAYLKGKISLL